MTEACHIAAEISPSISTNIYDKQTTINQELPTYPWPTLDECMWKNPIIEPLSERMERLLQDEGNDDIPPSTKSNQTIDEDTACIASTGDTENDPVNHPAHYTYGTIETIDYIEDKEQNFNLGNAIKYVSRAGHKINAVEDLQKAVWYINREISRLQKRRTND